MFRNLATHRYVRYKKGALVKWPLLDYFTILLVLVRLEKFYVSDTVKFGR
jgi:hypothetical protein